MTPTTAESLRRSAAHVLVDDVDMPVLDEQASHHVFGVLRAGDGETVTVTDGRGAWRVCRAARGLIEPHGEPQLEPATTDPLTIAFAIPKQDRPEWIVQKLTEIGVDRIVLLHAERSVVRWDAARAEKHAAKLRRVAEQALQQSRRVWLPDLDGPIDSADLLVRAVAAEPGGRPVTRADRVIAIGPEGGWSPAELAIATGRVSLGATVLRVETAALVAATRAIDHGL